jgi:hypothetical protein
LKNPKRYASRDANTLRFCLKFEVSGVHWCEKVVKVEWCTILSIWELGRKKWMDGPLVDWINQDKFTNWRNLDSWSCNVLKIEEVCLSKDHLNQFHVNPRIIVLLAEVGLKH